MLPRPRHQHFTHINNSTRKTLLFPILQISSVNSFDYHTATLVGLLPAQAINVYLGSKLRSIHDVINDNHTAIAGYGMFIFEVIEIAFIFVFTLDLILV